MTASDPGVAPTADSEAARISIQGLSKHFVRRSGESVPAVDNVSLQVKPGEFLVLLGPSGCGKTTLLRSIAGLETVDAGSIEIQGRVVADGAQRLHVPPERRRVSMMFQSYALWPHMTVYDNVAYPLAARKVPRRDIQERVREIMQAVGIEDLAGQYPAQTSGGQQQRVALARSLVAGDDVVLFDEPLSNVDARVREQLRTELLRLHRSLHFTAVYVTHDQDEALALASRIVVLRRGKVAQSSPPREMYEMPADAYVARFMGATDEVDAEVVQVSTDEIRVETPLGSMTGRTSASLQAGDAVKVFTRPEAWRFTAEQPDGANVWKGELAYEAFQGFYIDRFVSVAGQDVRVRTLADGVSADSHGWLSIAPANVLVLPGDAA